MAQFGVMKAFVWCHETWTNSIVVPTVRARALQQMSERERERGREKREREGEGEREDERRELFSCTADHGASAALFNLDLSLLVNLMYLDK